ncbi:MAG: CsgG/HfaB family protein [Opitutaceae bacterium]|jgi:curli biogenesis system outer membrane secretion channel CsgG
MKIRLLAPLALLAALGVFIAPARAGLSDLLKPGTATKTKDDTAGSKMPEYKGVKHAIGVIDFENQNTAFVDPTLSQNFRMMLESALFATNRFVIVERAEMDAVMKEQDLQAGGRAAKAAGVAQTGKLRSARYLATGTIVEASSDTSGDGGGLTIKGIHLGGSSAKSQIVVIVKLIDTTSGQIVANERIRGEAGKTSLNLSYTGADVGGGLGAFAKTPMGEAAQDCINQAVKFIAEKMESTAVEGTVVAVSGDQVIISLGVNYGIAAGQTCVVRKPGETLTDPSTGEILGTSEGETVGTIQVTSPRDKISYCKLVDGKMPERGNTVVLK